MKSRTGRGQACAAEFFDMIRLAADVRQDNISQIGDARHVAIAGLLRDDLARQAASGLHRRHFDDDHVLRDAAAFAVGSISTFGIAEVETIRRLLLRNYRPERVGLELQVIQQLTQFITAADLAAALLELEATADGAIDATADEAAA